MNVYMPLLPCEYRVPMDDPGRFYCRHSHVHATGNYVHVGICNACVHRTVDCADPRPTPQREVLAGIAPAAAPSLRRRAWNLAESLVAFVEDGMTTVTTEQYARRLMICDECEFRDGGSCRQCGCRLAIKARGRAFQCPEEKWPDMA